MSNFFGGLFRLLFIGLIALKVALWMGFELPSDDRSSSRSSSTQFIQPNPVFTHPNTYTNPYRVNTEPMHHQNSLHTQSSIELQRQKLNKSWADSFSY